MNIFGGQAGMPVLHALQPRHGLAIHYVVIASIEKKYLPAKRRIY
jgi:hypothetical protein